MEVINLRFTVLRGGHLKILPGSTGFPNLSTVVCSEQNTMSGNSKFWTTGQKVWKQLTHSDWPVLRSRPYWANASHIFTWGWKQILAIYKTLCSDWNTWRWTMSKNPDTV